MNRADTNSRTTRNTERAVRRFPLVWWLLLLAGCISITPHPHVDPSIIDARALLGAQDEFTTRRPTSISPKQPPESSRAAPARPRLSIDDDSDQTVGRLELALPANSLPRIEPADIIAEPRLELTVTAPTRRPAGSSATFHVTVRNPGDEPLPDLALRARFDEGLVFIRPDQGETEGEVRKVLDPLAAGETREFDLTLTGRAAGSRCCQISVCRTEGTAETVVVSKSACVEFVTRQLELDLVGPTQRTEGSRAEFVVRIMNRSVKTLTDTQAMISFDKALVPKEASQDHVRKERTLTWDLGALGPMERVQLQVEFECRSQARRACVTLDVKTGVDSHEQEEACVEVIPLPGPLELAVSDSPDPLEVGATGTLSAVVRNIGLAPARRVVLEAVVPDQVTIVKTIVTLDQTELPLKLTRDGNTVKFDAVDRLLPNGRLTYAFEVQGVRAGIAEFRARLTSSLGSAPITSGEPTIITDP